MILHIVALVLVLSAPISFRLPAYEYSLMGGVLQSKIHYGQGMAAFSLLLALILLKPVLTPFLLLGAGLLLLASSVWPFDTHAPLFGGWLGTQITFGRWLGAMLGLLGSYLCYQAPGVF